MDAPAHRVFRLRLGDWCPNACEHCKYQGGGRRFARYTSLFAPVGRRVPSSLGSGDTLLLHGPEPALQPGFADLVEAARARGAQVALYTTGRPFRERARVRQIWELGLRRFIVPVFGASAEAHDRVAGVAGAFAEAREGLALLARIPGSEIRLDVLVAPARATQLVETVASWRAVAPRARVRLVHLLPVGGASRHLGNFEGSIAALWAALRELFAQDPSLTVSHFDARRFPLVSDREQPGRDPAESFALLQKLDADCAGESCALCAHDFVCGYFRGRREQRFDTYNLTVEAPCHLACNFCMRRAIGGEGRQDSLEQILARFAQDGASPRLRRVRINGADPLQHPDILAVLEQVAARGIRELELFTPGLPLADADFTARLFAALAPFEAAVLIPIYGASAATHDEVMGTPGAFARLRQAMVNLTPYRERVRFTSLVLARNYRELGEVLALLDAEGFAMEPARFVRPFSDDPADYAAVAPRMRDVVEYHAARDPRRVRRILLLPGFPPCTYWDLCPTDTPLSEVEIDAGSYDTTSILRSHDQFRGRKDAVAHCDQPDCALYARCLNQVQYFRVHGYGEFRGHQISPLSEGPDSVS